MGIWKMSQLKAPPLTDDPAQLREYIKYLSNQLASMLKDLDFTLNGDVDFRNVRAKSIKADNLNVTELSAITANLGHITAGLIESIQIFGSYIATRNGTFPRAEINNTGDLLAVYTDANNYLTIEPGITNEPTITFRNGGTPSLILGPAFGFIGLISSLSLLVGTQNGSLQLECGTGPLDNVNVSSWNKFVNSSSGLSLQDELDAIQTALAGKANASHSHSVTIPNHNHGNVANTTSGGGTFTVS